MLFIRKPSLPAEYSLISSVYGLEEHGEDVPLMTKRDAIRAARYFLDLVDDPDATAQVVNTNNKQVYVVQRLTGDPRTFLVTWANGGC